MRIWFCGFPCILPYYTDAVMGLLDRHIEWEIQELEDDELPSLGRAELRAATSPVQV